MISLKSECMHAWNAQGVVRGFHDWYLKVTSMNTLPLTHSPHLMAVGTAMHACRAWVRGYACVVSWPWG